MRIANLAAAAGLIVVLTVPSSAAPAAAPPEFAAWIREKMGEAGIPGASVAVIRNFEIAWTGGFGLADKAAGTPVTPKTRFQAASVSKAFTAVAALIAASSHGVSVDDTVDAIFQRFPPPEAAGWTLPNPFATPVTLRMLLSHTGGTNDFHYSGYRYDYHRQPPGPIDPLPTLGEELRGMPPANTPAIRVVREPGVHWVYSPAGFTLIQAMLTGIEGRSFAALMEDLVLRPLALGDSSFEQPTPSAMTEGIAVPYIDADTPLSDGPRVFNTAASGGLTTTPSDLAKLMIAIQRALAGETTGNVTPEIARALLTRQTGTMLSGKCLPSGSGGFACDSSWGLGFDVNVDRYFNHPADGSATGGYFAHTGFNSGYLTILMASKSGGNGLALMVNVAPEDMAGDVPQFPFLVEVVRKVADSEAWR